MVYIIKWPKYIKTITNATRIHLKNINNMVREKNAKNAFQLKGVLDLRQFVLWPFVFMIRFQSSSCCRSPAVMWPHFEHSHLWDIYWALTFMAHTYGHLQSPTVLWLWFMTFLLKSVFTSSFHSSLLSSFQSHSKGWACLTTAMFV